MSKVKFVVLGDGGVGKSCVTIQWVNGTFSPQYDPTIENSYYKQATFGDETVMLEILDTAGQEDYIVIRDQHIRQGQAFFLVFSLAAKETFQTVGGFYQQILQVKEEWTDVPLVLIGNKSDLEAEREVSRKDAEEYASKIGAPYLETSAMNGTNINEAFDTLWAELKKWDKKNVQQKPPKRRCIII
eukprot:TRINITY_DN66_c0_g1_i1.p1 TRINITY_DN66_c0_g1~~TRINITY_DN66_c0_g1_i1.p1  ORF type:complete len:186 (+),score=52.80 TRINITY_DN66_c0_g1_i1:84-641(+)